MIFIASNMFSGNGPEIMETYFSAIFSLTILLFELYIYIYIFRCSMQASKFHKIPQYQPQYFFAWGLNLDFIKSKEKVFPTL